MRLEHSFTRTEATLIDAIPDAAAYLTNDNVFHAPQYGVDAEPIESVAIAIDGPVLELTVWLYLWDEFTEHWYLFAERRIDTGAIVFVPLPNIIDRKVSRGASRISVAVVADPDGLPPDGTYEFALASSTSGIPVGGGGSIEEPLEVEGTTAVGGVPATNPLDLGAVVQAADPGPFVDGDIHRLRLDDRARLITTNRTYDPVPDADRVIPVRFSYDNWEPLDFDQSVATDLAVSHYWDADTMCYFTLLLSTATAGATISVKLYASNDSDEPDITLRNYTEVTTDIFGGAINLTSASPVVIVVDTPIKFNSYKITFDSDIAATWTARGKMGAE